MRSGVQCAPPLGHSAFGKYFGWIEPSAEPTAREIALGGSLDWLSFGFGLALLIVGIIRLVGREVVVRKSLEDTAVNLRPRIDETNAMDVPVLPPVYSQMRSPAFRSPRKYN